MLETEEPAENIRNLAGDHWGGTRGGDDVLEDQGR